jgi:hypothetical protein
MYRTAWRLPGRPEAPEVTAPAAIPGRSAQDPVGLLARTGRSGSGGREEAADRSALGGEALHTPPSGRDVRSLGLLTGARARTVERGASRRARERW